MILYLIFDIEFYWKAISTYKDHSHAMTNSCYWHNCILLPLSYSRAAHCSIIIIPNRLFDQPDRPNPANKNQLLFLLFRVGYGSRKLKYHLAALADWTTHACSCHSGVSVQFCCTSILKLIRACCDKVFKLIIQFCNLYIVSLKPCLKTEWILSRNTKHIFGNLPVWMDE